MQSRHTRYSPLTLVLASALTIGISSPVHAQQVIADGDQQTPAAGNYSVSSFGNHAFHALNGGSIVPLGRST